MDDSEIKKLLLETCPVRPGQEERAWTALRDRLYARPSFRSRLAWLFVPRWHGALTGLSILCAVALASQLITPRNQPASFISARSESPGISATSFYSHAADAQVVWISGLEPATDRPTYLDPSGPADTESSTDDPANL